jgi:hypothetical protein
MIGPAADSAAVAASAAQFVVRNTLSQVFKARDQGVELHWQFASIDSRSLFRTRQRDISHSIESGACTLIEPAGLGQNQSLLESRRRRRCLHWQQPTRAAVPADTSPITAENVAMTRSERIMTILPTLLRSSAALKSRRQAAIGSRCGEMDGYPSTGQSVELLISRFPIRRFFSRHRRT